MNVYLIAFLVMLGVALIVILATIIPVLLRALRLNRSSRALQKHPTLVALRSAHELGGNLNGMPARLDRIRERSTRIAEAVTALLATSAILRLQVDRVGFATRLLLETFVPTLRGSMAD